MNGAALSAPKKFLWALLLVLAGGIMIEGCAPKTQARSQLEAVMEARRAIPSPAGPPGTAPAGPQAAPAPREEIPEEVIDALAEILLESEADESRPLPFYFLPQDELGHVDWVAAIELGVIDPVDDLDPEKKSIPPMDFNVVFKVKGDLPDVVYPHYPHTLWMDCKNCHPGIFVMQAGANQVTMDAITKGEYCGQCHGKVAFSLAECNRCHSRPKPGKSLIIPRG